MAPWTVCIHVPERATAAGGKRAHGMTGGLLRLLLCFFLRLLALAWFSYAKHVLTTTCPALQFPNWVACHIVVMMS